MLLPDDRLGVVSAGAGGRLTRPLSHPDPLEDAFQPSGGAFRGAGGSNPLSGMRRALDALESDKRDGASPSMVVVLLSDQNDPSSEGVREVVERAQKVGATVHGVRASDRKGPTFLEEIAAATGGSARRTDDPRQLPMMFQTLFDRLLPGRGTELGDGRLPVDKTVRGARLMVDTDDPKSVSVVRPDGERLRAGQSGPGVGWLQGDDAAMVSLDKPEAGTWRVDARPGSKVRAWVESDLKLSASLGVDRVEPGTAIPVVAHLVLNGRRVPHQNLPEGLSISAMVSSVQSAKARSLHDDGTEGDETADDGVFRTTLVAPAAPGLHDVSIQATAPGFLRRVVVPLLVLLKGKEPIPEPPKKDDPALAGAEAGEREATGPFGRVPPVAILGALALLVFLLVWWLRRRRAQRADGAGSTVKVKEARTVGFARIKSLEQDEIDSVVEGYLSFVGRTLPDAPKGMELDDRVIQLVDRKGEFTSRLREVLGGRLHFDRLQDAGEARERLLEEPPELLILVDPFVGDTIPSFLHWLCETADLAWLPVVRVVEEPTRKGVIDELRAGALDVMTAHAEGMDLLRRVARAISAGDGRREAADKKKRGRRKPAPQPEPEPEVLDLDEAPLQLAEPPPELDTDLGEDFDAAFEPELEPELEPEPERVPDPADAARAGTAERKERYRADDDFEWVADRLDRLPLPLRIIADDGDAEGVLVDVGTEGFAVAARSRAPRGMACEFESDLFVSLALERVLGNVARCRSVEAEEYPYLWEIDYGDLDEVHRKRIENCYWGLVNSL